MLVSLAKSDPIAVEVEVDDGRGPGGGALRKPLWWQSGPAVGDAGAEGSVAAGSVVGDSAVGDARSGASGIEDSGVGASGFQGSDLDGSGLKASGLDGSGLEGSGIEDSWAAGAGLGDLTGAEALSAGDLAELAPPPDAWGDPAEESDPEIRPPRLAHLAGVADELDGAEFGAELLAEPREAEPSPASFAWSFEGVEEVRERPSSARWLAWVAGVLVLGAGVVGAVAVLADDGDKGRGTPAGAPPRASAPASAPGPTEAYVPRAPALGGFDGRVQVTWQLPERANEVVGYMAVAQSRQGVVLEHRLLPPGTTTTVFNSPPMTRDACVVVAALVRGDSGMVPVQAAPVCL